MGTFEGWGYSGGKIVAPGLDMVLSLGLNKHFRNDGAVLDVAKHAYKVHDEIGKDRRYMRIYDGKPLLGLHVPMIIEENNVSAKGSVIFWKRSRLDYEVFYAGYEMMHAYEFLGLDKDILIDELHRLGFYMNPFEMYEDREMRAHVGGLLGCYKKGFCVPRIGLSEIDVVFRDMCKSRRH